MFHINYAKLKAKFLYGGLSQHIYSGVTPFIIANNNSASRGLAFVMMIYGGLLSVLSFFNLLSKNVLPAYLYLFISSFVLLYIRKYIDLEKPILSYVYTTLLCVTLLVFGILNSSVFSPTRITNGTAFVALLLVIPFIMIDLPYRQDMLLIIMTVIYIICMHIFKNRTVFVVDTANAISFCTVSCVCNWIFSCRTITSLADRLYIENERDSDALTGLYSRKSGRIMIENHVAHGSHGAFMIIDVDNFKHFNDTYGHQYGDIVLKKVADCLMKSSRATDVACRFGGDEFVLFCVDVDMEMAENVAARFQELLKDCLEEKDRHVTTSIGISEVGMHADYERFFEDADKALYEAKERGKNCFVSHKTRLGSW